MTLTLELPTEIEAALTEKAARRGVPLNALILDAVTQYAAREENGAARRACGYGIAAGLGVTVEDFHAAKREEIDLEEKRAAQWNQSS